MNIDVFYGQEDQTALRWLRDLYDRLRPFQEMVNIQTFEVGCARSRQLEITTDSVVVNDRKIANSFQLEKILIEFAKQFVSGKRELD